MGILSPLPGLSAAFAQAGVAALHVDLQKRFFKQQTMNAFFASSALAAAFRDHGVPNNWIAYTHGWATGPYQAFKERYRDHNYDFHRSVHIAPDESVIEKDAMGAFDNPLLADRLHASGRKTLIVGGVIHSACVTETIRGALNRGFDVYAVVDATDCDPRDYGRWKNWILPTAAYREKSDRLTLTVSRMVVNALELAP